MVNRLPGRRGLVLQGGGVKGGFTFGALLALADYDIRFDAISGTSAGALNACLWASSDRALVLKEGWSIWTDLRFRDAISASSKNWIVIVCMLPAILLKFYGHVAVRPQPARWGWTVLLWISLYLFFWHTQGSAREACVAAVFITLLLRPVFAGDSSARIDIFVYWLYYAIIGVLALLSDHVFGSDFVTSLVVAHPKTYTIAYCAPLISLLIYKANISALDMTPLNNTVERILQSDLFIPTYITMTERRDLYDPDNIKYKVSDDPLMISYAGRTTHDRPIYVPLHEQPLSLRTKNVMASAALPFGIVESPTLNGHAVIDGGVADNIPLFPLVEEDPCDSVIIIRLEPAKQGLADTYDLEVLRDTWKKLDRLIRLDKENFRAVSGDNVPLWSGHNNFPEQEPRTFPRQILTIAPSRSFSVLGTFLFTRKFTRPLVEEGYLATCEQLSKVGFKLCSSDWQEKLKSAEWAKILAY